MDEKILKNKLEALKNSRKIFENLAKKLNSRSSSKPKVEKDKSNIINPIRKLKLF